MSWMELWEIAGFLALCYSELLVYMDQGATATSEGADESV